LCLGRTGKQSHEQNQINHFLTHNNFPSSKKLI
jgi:hypothetical protein